jgi:hypothetical protein
MFQPTNELPKSKGPPRRSALEYAIARDGYGANLQLVRIWQLRSGKRGGEPVVGQDHGRFTNDGMIE